MAGPRALPAPARSVTAAVSESAGCSGGAWDCGYADLVQSEPGEKRATGGLMGYPTTIADRERFPLKRGHKDRVRGSGATGLPFIVEMKVRIVSECIYVRCEQRKSDSVIGEPGLSCG